MTDYAKVKARGPWLYMEILAPEEKDGMKLLASGLYVADGITTQRLGLTRGRVLSIGRGKWSDKSLRYVSPREYGIEEGMVIFYRGYLQEVNKPHPLVDNYCFINMESVMGYEA